ncbi:MAG: hypothetical protein JXB88_24550 [Spirochaetales bacterium]|nr:hypothetical protein [Spirochaetales bacterium]
MVEFDDEETSALMKELDFPIIRDICKEFHGDIFDQDRRYLSQYIELYSKNQRMLHLPPDSFLFSYRNLFKYLRDIELIPPLEELDGVIYDAYNSHFDAIFDLLKLY